MLDTQLTLLSEPAAAVPADPTMLRVTTFNVQHSAPTRCSRQARWLASTGADVLILTEVPGGHSVAALGQGLAEQGYGVHLPPAAGCDYRVMLCWRRGDLEVVDSGIEILPHRCVAARLRLPVSADTGHPAPTTVGLVGLYVPSRGPKQRRNVDKRAFQQAVTAALPGWVATQGGAAGPLVVAGDLNVIEPGHTPAHTNFGAWEYGFYTAFAACGLADAFRHLHPQRVDHSWYGRRSGDGYRFDHLFCDTPHLPRLTSCGYDHDPRQTGLSDHAALSATLTLAGT